MRGPTADHDAGRTRESNNLQVLYGGLSAPKESRIEDGVALVNRCLAGLDDPMGFPPAIFILWATKAFQPYADLLAGIRRRLKQKALDQVPVIGASVAACLFDGEAHERGAVLTCLASRLLKARAAVGTGAQRDPAAAVDSVLEALGMKEGDINPLRNRFLVIFLPGYESAADPTSYRAPEILDELRRKTYGRLYMFGGVTSGGLEMSLGSQFLGDRVYTGAVVIAQVDSDIALGVGLSQGLTGTGRYYHVKEVADNGRTVKSFLEGSAQKVWESLKDPRIFGMETTRGDHVIAVPKWVKGRKGSPSRMHLLRKVNEGTSLQVMVPEVARLREDTLARREWILRRFSLRESRVVGILSVGCVSRYKRRQQIGLDMHRLLQDVKERFPGASHVGCYMDGEVGADRGGRTIFGNWSVSDLFLGDQIPMRSAYYLISDALAQYIRDGAWGHDLKETMEETLSCVQRAGYKGGMISLVFENDDRKWIVAHAARGGRWAPVVMPRTRRELPGGDVLAIVAEEKSLRFVRDARTDRSCDNPTAVAGSVISQCVIPLLDRADRAGSTLGILQVDLGDCRDQDNLTPDQSYSLTKLGNLAAVALNLVIRTEELELGRKLDSILANCARQCKTVDEAATLFVREAALKMGVDETQVGLLTQDRSRLRWIQARGGGDTAGPSVGEIHVVPGSPVFRCLSERSPRTIIVNDAESHATLAAMGLQGAGSFAGTEPWTVRAFAYFPIAEHGERPIGVVSFESQTRWFFTQSRLRSLKDIGLRLARLLAYVREKHAKEEVFTNTAHSLKAPLHTAITYLSLARERLSKGRHKAANEALSLAYQVLLSASTHARAAETFFQGYSPPPLVPVDLHSILSEYMELLGSAGDAGVVIELEPEDKGPLAEVEAEADEGLARLVIWELLTNAVSAVRSLESGPAGGMKDRRGRIKATWLRRDDHVELQIRNPAPSLDKPRSEQLLANAASGIPSPRSTSVGTGLGLHYCHKMMVAMSGSLRLSKEGNDFVASVRFRRAQG
ncbi:MAG: hypothetical protein HY721_16990 [Planctomycetes bacterium]|nr:hypothetical protein [Planctomycetota bacterium]